MSITNFTNQPPFKYEIPWRENIPKLPNMPHHRHYNAINSNNITYGVTNHTIRHGVEWEMETQYLSKISPLADLFVGVYLLLVQILSVFFNGLVLGISVWKRKHLKTSDVFVACLAASDIGHPLTAYPMVITSSFMHEWIYGDIGCRWNGFTSFFFGINSMMTLTAMSFNRYLYIRHTDIARHNKRVITFCLLGIVLISSVFWSVSPLVGWGHYGPEPFRTSCTLIWDYPDRSFVTSIFVCILGVPVLVMFYSYGCILFLAMETRHRRFKWSQKSQVYPAWQKKEMRLLKITMLMCFSYVLFWTPYAVVAMIKSYARHIHLSPAVSLIPCLAAKTSHAADPVIYCFFNKNFSRYIPFMFSRKRRQSQRTLVRSPTTQTVQFNAVLGIIRDTNS